MNKYKKVIMKKSFASSVSSIEKLKILKFDVFQIKQYSFLLFVISAAVMIKKYLKDKNRLKY